MRWYFRGRQTGQILARSRRRRGSTPKCLRRHFDILPSLAVFTGIWSFVLDLFHRLMFTPSVHPTEGVLMRRMRTWRMRRLRVRPRQPGLRGPWETPPGPTTWVRPATGWWKRMNAGESPRNQGRSVCRSPLSVSRRRSRGLIKMPRRGADRRAGPRDGPAVPSRWRDGLCRKAATGCGVPHQRLSALRPLGLGDIPQRRPGARFPER